MRSRSGSVTNVFLKETIPARPRGRRSKRGTRGIAAVERPAKASRKSVGDLRILNRIARRLNREARDVLSFQVPV